MYLKPVYQPEGLQQVHDLIERVVLGTLVAVGPSGLTAAHLPFMVDRDRGEHGTLVCHLAAANPQAELVRAGVDMMAVFLGPEAYVSSSWFVQRDNAPTWAYAAVHCHGRPVVQDDRASVRNIARLVDTLEQGRGNRWELGELGPGGLARRMPRIVCFEMPIDRVEARFQLGQEEAAVNMAAAAAALDQQDEQEVAALIRQYNRNRP